MKVIYPERNTAIKRGWKYQVQWIEDGKPCFVRYSSGEVADEFARRVRRQGCEVVVIDLVDEMQLDQPASH